MDGTRSQKAELLAYIVLQEKLKPNETIMVSDRKHDIIGASANQIKSVAVTWGYGSKEELVSVEPTSFCHSPSDLPKTILNT